MKLTQASGKVSVKLSYSDWLAIGKKSGWIKEAMLPPEQPFDQLSPEDQQSLINAVKRFLSNSGAKFMEGPNSRMGVQKVEELKHRYPGLDQHLPKNNWNGATKTVETPLPAKVRYQNKPEASFE